eukprot:UN34811
MFDECNDESLGHVGHPAPPQIKKKNEKNENWYTVYRTTIIVLLQVVLLRKTSRVYSPFERGFYDLTPQEPSIQDFTTPNELQALCRLLGPGGVRVIDGEMIGRCTNIITEIKTCLVANQVMVQKDIDVSSSEKWSQSSKTFRQLDRLTHHATLLGLILCFRKELRAALKVVALEKTPFMARSVGLVHERLLEHGVNHPKFNAMALDFGVQSAMSDSIMHQIVLKKLKENSNNQSEELQFHARAIPTLFGFMFISNAWRNVFFDVPTGALSNNGMCIAHTIQLLLDSITNQGKARAELARELKLKFLR